MQIDRELRNALTEKYGVLDDDFFASLQELLEESLSGGNKYLHVDIKLTPAFIRKYTELKNLYGHDLARLNGFADEQLSYTDFIDNFIDKDVVADASVDASANVSRKDIVTLEREMPKPHSKLLAFNKIHYELAKEYGPAVADTWLEMEWLGQLYMHDAPSTSFRSYCEAYTLKSLAERGLFFIQGQNPEPAKHLSTFVDFVKEFVSFAANRTSGAVGLPDLIPYMFYFWKKDVDADYMGIRTSGNARYYAIQAVQRVLYALNQPYVREGVQSAFTNTSVFDRPYFEALFGGSEFPDGTFVIDFEEEIIEFQKLYMEVMSDTRSRNMFTFPVSTISLLRKDGKFEDEEFAEWAIRHNMKWSDSNFFIDDSVSSLSNCCRLRNDVRDLFINSIGGTALNVGSVKVNTVNLARIALDTESEEEYLEELKKRVGICLCALDRVRHIIKRNVEKGLLPNFSYGLLAFEHLYNTIGFIGVYETLKKFGYTRVDEFGNTFYTEDASRFGSEIFQTIRDTADAFISVHGCDYKVNVEQIPGESAADKLMQKDKMFYPDAGIYDLPLYGNQFIPLGVKTTLQERIRIAATFDKYCNGGSVLHANLDAPFDSFEKAKTMTEYISDQGVTYFAFNSKIQACDHNHGFYGKVCPECGGPATGEYTRIVG